MPYPGTKCATSCAFGKLSDLDPEFTEQMKMLASMILAPENLVKKNINGYDVKVKDLLMYCKSYIDMFQGDKLLEPKTIFMVLKLESYNISMV